MIIRESGWLFLITTSKGLLSSTAVEIGQVNGGKYFKVRWMGDNTD